MATVRGGKGQIPVGSSQWISNEQDHIAQFEADQLDDFAFSARNDFEWLNEHMAEIFSANQLNVTEIFKTPGKLRGKTPRTARKKNLLANRAPLTDVFSTDIRFNKSPTRPAESQSAGKLSSPVKEGPFPLKFASPDKGRNEVPPKQATQVTDSGYYGLTEDEMEVNDGPSQQISRDLEESAEQMQLDSAVDVGMDCDRLSDERTATDGSFHSARENMTAREIGKEDAIVDGESDEKTSNSRPVNKESPSKLDITNDEDVMKIGEAQKAESTSAEVEGEASPSSSNTSTPDKPFIRESLTFASLPAREPIAKKSFGNRVSRTSQSETAKKTVINGGSYFGRFTGGKSIGAVRPLEDDDDAMKMDKPERSGAVHERVDGDGKIAQLHNKSSTQRLHERINLLGKTQQPPRPTKSIPASELTPQVLAEPPKSVSEDGFVKEQNSPKPSSSVRNFTEDEDDDWIRPPVKSDEASYLRLSKSRSVDVMEQVTGKETIGGADLGMGPSERQQAIDQSPQHADVRSNLNEENRGATLRKAISTTVLASPSRSFGVDEQSHVKQISVSNPTPTLRHTDSTTPPGSPPKFSLEGHLSASKSKLQSIMKSARGLFTSSAGASAQAKMETLSPSSLRLRLQEHRALQGIDETISKSTSNENLYPNLTATAAVPPVPESPKGRKTRSSTEKEKEERRKEKEAKDRQKVESELEKAREQERQKAAKFKEQMKSVAAKSVIKSAEDIASLEKTSKPIRQSPRRLAKEEGQSENTPKTVQHMPPPARPATAMSLGQSKGKDIRRPVRPAKEPPAKSKAPPVSIRVGTMSQRVNTTLANNLQDSVAPSQQRPQGPVKKASNASIQTSASTSSFKSSTSSQNSKPKALIAAERKKEQDEREALRKQEQKREIERKRAAAQEEAQRREQKQREEAERLREKEKALAAEQEAKKLAHKQAVEKRRLELIKKEQQQQQHRDAQRALNDLGYAIEAEKSHQPITTQRADMGNSKGLKLQDFPRPPGAYPAVNPAKPPIKRVFDPDNDDELSRPTRPLPGQNFHASEGKRRKTDEDELVGPTTRPAMAPPIRQSNIRKANPAGFKTQELSKSNTYGTAAPGPAPSVFKPSTSNQTYQAFHNNSHHHHQHHQQQQQQVNRPNHPMDMAKYTSSKIPFAEAPNPPATAYRTPHHQSTTSGSSSSKMMAAAGTSTAPRSSPGFINGEHIHLPEIATDSEDEDSDDERERRGNMPDWVRTPNLFQNLSDQERINPDHVFGPVAPLNMEEMFKDKSRHQKFRARTSSANWFGADRLTEEDVRNDLAARERLRKDGGWTYRNRL